MLLLPLFLIYFNNHTCSLSGSAHILKVSHNKLIGPKSQKVPVHKMVRTDSLDPAGRLHHYLQAKPSGPLENNPSLTAVRQDLFLVYLHLLYTNLSYRSTLERCTSELFLMSVESVRKLDQNNMNYLLIFVTEVFGIVFIVVIIVIIVDKLQQGCASPKLKWPNTVPCNGDSYHSFSHSIKVLLYDR